MFPSHEFFTHSPPKIMTSRSALPVPRRRQQNGVHTVEFALTIGIFMLIFFSAVVGVFYVYAYSATIYLAREGVQYAIKRGNDAATAAARNEPSRPDAPADLNRITSYLSNKNLLSPITVDACWSGSVSTPCTLSSPSLVAGTNNIPGMPVQVTVTYIFRHPTLSGFWPNLIQFQSSSQGIILF